MSRPTLFHDPPFDPIGELQRTHFHAAASVRGPGVPRAAGQGIQVSELPGADVLRGRLHRLVLLHHRPPHQQALQPSAGGNLRAGSPARVRLPLSLRTGSYNKPSTF